MKYGTMFCVGLLCCGLAVTGCAKPANNSDKPAKTADKAAGHEHEHAHGAGPNGGVLFDFGKHHGEFTVDHGKQEVTVVIIGEDEKTPMAIDAKELTVSTKETKTKEGKVVAPMTIMLMPTDAKDGKASKFVGTDAGVGNVADFAGTVIGDVDGKPAQGQFKE